MKTIYFYETNIIKVWEKGHMSQIPCSLKFRELIGSFPEKMTHWLSRTYPNAKIEYRQKGWK